MKSFQHLWWKLKLIERLLSLRCLHYQTLIDFRITFEGRRYLICLQKFLLMLGSYDFSKFCQIQNDNGGDLLGGSIHSQGFLDQAEDPGIGHFLDVPILLLRCTRCTHWQWSAVIWVLFCCCGRMWSLKLLCWPFLRRNFIIKMVNSHSFTLFFRGHQS